MYYMQSSANSIQYTSNFLWHSSNSFSSFCLVSSSSLSYKWSLKGAAIRWPAAFQFAQLVCRSWSCQKTWTTELNRKQEIYFLVNLLVLLSLFFVGRDVDLISHCKKHKQKTYSSFKISNLLLNLILSLFIQVLCRRWYGSIFIGL